jgi:hypothetical protein
MGNAAGELNHLDAAGYLAKGVRVGLAVLGGDGLGECPGIGIEQFLEAEHHPRASERRRRRPLRIRRQRRRDRRGDIVGAGQADAGDVLTGGRVHDRRRAPRADGHLLAVDDVRDSPHGFQLGVPTWRRPGAPGYW